LFEILTKSATYFPFDGGRFCLNRLLTFRELLWSVSELENPDQDSQAIRHDRTKRWRDGCEDSGRKSYRGVSEGTPVRADGSAAKSPKQREGVCDAHEWAGD